MWSLESIERAEQEHRKKQEKAMNEHSKLLEDARGWASIDASTDRKAILRTLADLVEWQDAVIAETVGACKTCDEAIKDTLYAVMRINPSPAEPPVWIELRAAGHLAGNAAKLAEPNMVFATCEVCGHVISCKRQDWTGVCNAVCGRKRLDATLAEATAKYDDLLRRLAGIGDTTNEAEPSARANRAETLRRLAECAEPPAPPVEVEMRVVPTTHGWTWELAIDDPTSPRAKLWVTPSILNHGMPIDTSTLAVARGNAWLAALSAQLGVPLVGVWEEGE